MGHQKKNLIDSLGELSTFMLQPPEPEEIDQDGALSKTAQDQMDLMILKAAEKRISGFYMPQEIGHGSDPNNKWRTVSTMQKAIRHGNAEMAMFAASAAFDMDKAYVTKRLAVVAVEDCLMGNPFDTMTALAMLGHHQWRKAIDERRLLIYLANGLAKGAKDRTAVNLLVWAGIEDTVPKKVWGKASYDDLATTAQDTDLNIGQRMCAAWLLGGTKRYGGGGMPEDNDRSPAYLLNMMTQSGMCRMTLYFAAKTRSRLSDGMWVSMYLIDEMLRNAVAPIMIKDEWVPEQVMVGKLLGAGYDKHTREGNTAIRKFFKECSAMKPFIDATPPDDRSHVQGTGVFLAEGGTLDRRYIYGEDCDYVTHRVRSPLRFAPYMGEELAELFIPTIRENLTQLNECREKVLWAKLNS